ncbi:hypothetical protein NHE_0854 [Neorickettsia helminthoeca str. Oregon]|uniref:Uncharacterized protein n=1 Tax=Neorickettsia helminthoeca str. Oregon TaxID=1286528 RepID=X5HKZ8_9RICK|nr:hypothetical protein NHE_0854 [Neorickettsia helminthoeca str. Oregon]
MLVTLLNYCKHKLNDYFDSLKANSKSSPDESKVDLNRGFQIDQIEDSRAFSEIIFP